MRNSAIANADEMPLSQTQAMHSSAKVMANDKAMSLNPAGAGVTVVQEGGHPTACSGTGDGDG